MAGPVVSVADFQLAFHDEKWWLEVKVVNAGRADIDLDGAWAGWLGPALTEMPARLTSGSSATITFKGTLPPSQYLGDPLTIQIGMGDGSMLLKRIRLNDAIIAAQLAGKVGVKAHVTERDASALPIEEV
jgi:hypothetical protein